ncbi:MAG: precorrin-6y C5,15-methyltransferase (decarboxylating) subunit CbiE [Eubacterium sp.]|nr:precorrin-6y C5,15-methyltransferase (decarboxylating) subunit CbiE [Eubacterium sp.]
MDRQIALIGIGMGGTGGTMTCQAREYIETADLLIGAKRMLEAAKPLAEKRAEFYPEYRVPEIIDILEERKACRKAAVLLSGDLGFYSGAKKLSAALKDPVTFYPGISSVVYFAAKLKMSWDDMKILSAHGRNANLVGEINSHHKVFAILGTTDGVQNLAKKLVYYQIPDLTVYAGQNLGYEDEEIKAGKPEDFVDYKTTTLSVVTVVNPHPIRYVTHGIPDEEFIRDKVPMTKEEVREVSVSKMRLEKDSIVYDIGAGSGSVSIEMACKAVEGQVYAIEKKDLAVELLKKNKQKFAADNVTIVPGLAPDALKDLPVPTHAFIGGSSGNLFSILELLLAKNPKVRVVINCITLETVTESLNALDKLPFEDVDIVSITAAKSKKIANYNMMMGQNPVYVISCTGCAEKK